MLVNNMSMSTYRQIARQRQISADFRHSAIISLASERLFSTLSNTLNCIKHKNFGQDLCCATAEAYYFRPLPRMGSGLGQNAEVPFGQ
jgi:hypothetical protein